LNPIQVRFLTALRPENQINTVPIIPALGHLVKLPRTLFPIAVPGVIGPFA